MKENIPGYHITKDGKVYTHKKGYPVSKYPPSL